MITLEEKQRTQLYEGYYEEKLAEAAVQLQCWLKVNLPDEQFESIPIYLWNDVTFYREFVLAGSDRDT